MKNKSYLTAISRKKMSAPARWLWNEVAFTKTLDYGCGKSVDWIVLGADRYDPHYCPERPKYKYDNILCTYVLNVVDRKTEKSILKDIKGLLNKDGTAYITVRRDFRHGYKNKNGTFQRYVILDDYPIVRETSDYCIYKMEK